MTTSRPEPTTRAIAVVAAGLSTPSSTRLLADRLTAATVDSLHEQGIGATVEIVELRDHARELADFLLQGFAGDSLQAAIDTVTGADAVIAVTPIFTGSYSGLFKLFFDVIDKDSLDATPVLLGATAGTARHSLAIEHAMRPLFAYLHATVVPTAVFAAPDDWADGSLAMRINRAGAELATLLAGAATTPPRPATDPAGTIPSFESLLRRSPR